MISLDLLGASAYLISRTIRFVKYAHNNSACRFLVNAGTGTKFGPLARVYGSRSQTRISVGSWCDLHAELKIFTHSGSISVGDYTFIGPGTRIWSAEEVIVGSRVLISHDCEIHDCNAHPLDAAARHLGFLAGQGHAAELEGVGTASVTIEDDVWIGFRSVILKGVRIGRGAIVGANSVVLDDVPPWTLVAGVPARAIKQLASPAVESTAP